MVLFDDDVEVLDLTQLNRGLVVGVVALDRGRGGTAFVDGDLLGLAVQLDRSLQIAPGRPSIPLGSQQKINGVAIATHGPIQVLPLAAYPNIDLVHTPALAHRPRRETIHDSADLQHVVRSLTVVATRTDHVIPGRHRARRQSDREHASARARWDTQSNSIVQHEDDIL